MTNSRARLIVFLSLAVFFPAVPAAECGLLFDVAGKFACRAGDGKAVQLRAFAPFSQKTVCQLSDDARMTFTHYATQREYRVSGPGELGLDCVGIAPPKTYSVRQVPSQSQDRLRVVAATYLVQGAMAMRSPMQLAVDLLGEDTRLLQVPTRLRYALPPDVASARFSLLDDAGREVFAASPAGGAIALQQGVVAAGKPYRWILAAGGESIAGRFIVADDAQARALRAARPALTADGALWMNWIADVHAAGFERDARDAVESLRAEKR